MHIHQARRAALTTGSTTPHDPNCPLSYSSHKQSAATATIEWGFTNGIAESNNSVIGRIRRNANGFHNPQSFITMIMLDRGGLGPNLPWTP